MPPWASLGLLRGQLECQICLTGDRRSTGSILIELTANGPPGSGMSFDSSKAVPERGQCPVAVADFDCATGDLGERGDRLASAPGVAAALRMTSRASVGNLLRFRLLASPPAAGEGLAGPSSPLPRCGSASPAGDEQQAPGRHEQAQGELRRMTVGGGLEDPPHPGDQGPTGHRQGDRGRGRRPESTGRARSRRRRGAGPSARPRPGRSSTRAPAAPSPRRSTRPGGRRGSTRPGAGGGSRGCPGGGRGRARGAGPSRAVPALQPDIAAAGRRIRGRRMPTSTGAAIRSHAYSPTRRVTPDARASRRQSSAAPRSVTGRLRRRSRSAPIRPQASQKKVSGDPTTQSQGSQAAARSSLEPATRGAFLSCAHRRGAAVRRRSGTSAPGREARSSTGFPVAGAKGPATAGASAPPAPADARRSRAGARASTASVARASPYLRPGCRVPHRPHRDRRPGRRSTVPTHRKWSMVQPMPSQSAAGAHRRGPPFFVAASAPPPRPAAAGVPASSRRRISARSSSLSFPVSTMCATRPRAEPSKTRSMSLRIIVVPVADRLTRADQTDARAFSPSARSTSPFSCITLSIVATVVVATGRSRPEPGADLPQLRRPRLPEHLEDLQLPLRRLHARRPGHDRGPPDWNDPRHLARIRLSLFLTN